MARRELQFSGQQGLEEDGSRQEGVEERHFAMSKNLAELFADKEETVVGKVEEWATQGECCQSVATEEQRDKVVDDHGEGSKAGCHPAQQHPMGPVGESVSSEGALHIRSTSIVEESVVHTALSPSFGPPAKKVRRSLQGFLFTSQTSDTSQQTDISLTMECDTREGDIPAKQFMQPGDFLSSGIGYLTDLQQVPPREIRRPASPLKPLSTQEHHSCMHTLPPENQASTIDLTADRQTAAPPTVCGCYVESSEV